MGKPLRWTTLAAVTTALLLLWACDDEGFTTEPAPEDLGAICAYHSDCNSWCTEGLQFMSPYCTRSCADQACPAGYVCVSRELLGRVCAMGECDSDDDCPIYYHCHTDEHVCRHDDIPCSVDADCPAGMACNQGACETRCETDDDCKQGYHCDFHSGCLQCTRDSHCEGGFGCVGGLCQTACVEETDCRAGFGCHGRACELIVGGGPGEAGAPCDEHADCVHFCHHYSYCSQVCGGPEDPPCPDGFRCQPDQLVCQPTQ